MKADESRLFCFVVEVTVRRFDLVREFEQEGVVSRSGSKLHSDRQILSHATERELRSASVAAQVAPLVVRPDGDPRRGRLPHGARPRKLASRSASCVVSTAESQRCISEADVK